MSILPDKWELDNANRKIESFIEDPETYYYFRDEVFIDDLIEYVKRKRPKNMPPGKVIDGKYYSKGSDVGFSYTDGGGEATELFDTIDYCLKYFRKWEVQYSPFHVYKGEIYTFVVNRFFWNPANEIELIKLEKNDIAFLLNKAFQRTPKRRRSIRNFLFG